MFSLEVQINACFLHTDRAEEIDIWVQCYAVEQSYTLEIVILFLRPQSSNDFFLSFAQQSGTPFFPELHDLLVELCSNYLRPSDIHCSTMDFS